MSAPPILPCSKTKSKLEGFKYVQEMDLVGSKRDGSINAAKLNKENRKIVKDRFTSSAPQRSPHSSLPSTQKARQDGQKSVPRTPVGRVPLAELMSNRDEAFELCPKHSPGEQLYWHHSPYSSTQASVSMSPRSRSRKKRARSSSPISSSQNELLTHVALPKHISSLNLQTLQQSLRTPQADPAGDLWSRYSLKKSEEFASPDAAAESFAFLGSSSPQTPAKKLSSGNSGLRRSFSCRTDWPTSATKRRKIQKSHSQIIGTSTIEFFKANEALPEESMVSRVSMLVEELYDGLADPTTGLQNDKKPNSSLNSHAEKPTRRMLEPLKLDSGSESEAVPHVVIEDVEDGEDVSDDQFSKSATHIGDENRPADKESSSEFGDDDLDSDIFAEAHVKLAAYAEQNIEMNEPTRITAARSNTPNEDERAWDGLQVLPNPLLPNEAENTHDLSTIQHTSGAKYREPKMAQTRDFDDDDSEFDDDVFDGDCTGLMASDLEHLAAMVDQGTVGKSNESSDGPSNQPKGNNTKMSAKGADIVGIPSAASDDEFGGDDLDLEQISASIGLDMERADQYYSSGKNLSTIQRYVVMKVVEGTYDTGEGYNRSEKVLLVQDGKTKAQKAVTLRQTWFDSPCTPGSYVNIIGSFDKFGQCIIDDANNMLILHPDHLISATVVADSFSCTRRAVLQDRVKATNEANEPQVYGHILHEIFQEAMKANRWDTAWFRNTIELIASRYLETLSEINVEVVRAVEHLMSKVPELQSWAALFVTARPKPNAVVKDRNGTSALMSVSKLLDVEEHVWSPKYGLKGNIDATVQVVMKDSNEEKTLTVPFEVKTGKIDSNAAHKAQTVLYTLLLSDRYDIQIAYGILYYMGNSEISRIPAIRNELRHMIIQRNELACYVRHRLELPPMLKRSHLCGKCYARTPCFIYHKLVDNGDGETSGLKEKFDEVVNHLKPIHQEFFNRWDDLLTKEETDVLKFRRELWTMLSSEREKVGRCFGNVVIQQETAYEEMDAPKINRFHYTFVKPNASSAFSFTESQITVGEPIVISDEEAHFALANGYVTYVHRQSITVAVDRRLGNARVRCKDFDPVRYQSFAGIMEVVGEDDMGSTTKLRAVEQQALYRIDKDEFSNGMATVRNNLIKVMEKDLFGAQALRKLIIEGIPPAFKAIEEDEHMPKTASQVNLNVDQRRAIKKVMSAKDYALVLGMPGTGKTTTIAHIIRALAAQGKSILLTSYTHTAVDNILLKIRHDGIGILRLGAVAKIHHDVQDFADLAGMPKTNLEELKVSYGRQVVATTCLGINHPILNQRIFDYCIVDEASQITLPVCLGPIRMARTFILVGDHYQLPPLVQNKEAQEGGLDVSLFKLLSDKHPSSVVNLEHQYRMCEEIMSLSNTLIYEGRLKCGTPAVASRSISIPKMEALSIHHHSPSAFPGSQKCLCPGPSKQSCWIRSLLDPSVKVSFINTDRLIPISREIACGSRITNPIEAALATQLVESLITVGIKASDIGVITLYRSQLALLKQNLRHICPNSSVTGGTVLEMHTADKFQGRDKEVVVLSLVRSNEAKNVGDLLKDWRRVNVALTRARTKLLILGSWETMRKGNDLLRRFVELVDDRGWRFDLQPGALEGHTFEGRSATQVAGGSTEVKAEAKEKTKTKAKVNEERTIVRGKRMAEKVKGLDTKALLKKRPVMRDIVNEALG